MKTLRPAFSFAFRDWTLRVGRRAFSVGRVERGLLARLLFALLLLPISAVRAQVDEAPYFGDWENNRGDTLQITGGAIQINNNKAVRYDDITEDSDEENFFVLQIKDSIELSYFGGNFLRITFGKDPDHFTMSIYKSLPDALKQQNEVKRIEWSTPAEEKEEPAQTDQPKDQNNEDQKKEEGTTNSDQPKNVQEQEKPTPTPSASPPQSASPSPSTS
jgi:hypothetical protein